MDDDSDEGGVYRQTLTYRLCPRCLRTVPRHLGECYCVNDGTPLLEVCPQCSAPIGAPYTRFCARCGSAFAPQSGATQTNRCEHPTE